MKIKELLKKGNDILKEYNIEEYILKCRMLLSSLLGKDKEYLLIYDDQPVSENVKEDFFSGIEKIKNGLPIQYVINKQEFMCLNFFVNEYVLIPQPDTEVLVQEILQKINEKNKILDLCTGSGAIGISIASIMKDKNIEVYLSDISKLALEVAKKNAKKNNVSVKVIESDLFENIYEKFDIIVSNPPYIETETIK